MRISWFFNTFGQQNNQKYPKLQASNKGYEKVRSMLAKVCFKYGEEKPLPNFYAHKQMGDGRLNKCIPCTKNDVRIREAKLLKDPTWHESEKERHREKYYRLGYKEKHKPTPEEKKETCKRYEETYPEKGRVRSCMSTLRKMLGVPGNIHLHHWSYREGFEKDVILIEAKDHYLLHRHLTYDQAAMMYRTKDGELLDTNLKHYRYFMAVKSTHK